MEGDMKGSEGKEKGGVERTGEHHTSVSFQI